LSFAQFEREVIGERVRDKIAASKRKGIWVGGPVPLGYAAIDQKVIVVPAEAETVRGIFTRYLGLASVRALAEDLAGRGIRTRQRRLKDSRILGGGAFGVGGLAHLLRNRFYIGGVVYRGETLQGDHEPILDPALFAAVQAKLASRHMSRTCPGQHRAGKPGVFVRPVLLARRVCARRSRALRPIVPAEALRRGLAHSASSPGRR
jgi:hypothetical protein